MTLRGYRFLLAGIALWITLCLPAIAASWGHPSSGAGETLWRCGAFVGFGVVPFATIGLWREQRWGTWLLLVATIVASITFGSRGLEGLVGTCGLHYILLAIVLLRRLFPSPAGQKAGKGAAFLR